MSRKIIGVTVGTQLPKPNFKQTDPTKGDYIKNKPDFDGLKDNVDNLNILVGGREVSYQINDAVSEKSTVQIVTHDGTEMVSTLNIHKLTQEEYDQALANGTLDENALYLTPEEDIDLSAYATKDELSAKADENHDHNDVYYTKSEITDALSAKADDGHNHDDSYDVKGSANIALEDAKDYTNSEMARLVGDTEVSEQINDAIKNKSDVGHTHTAADVGALSPDDDISSERVVHGSAKTLLSNIVENYILNIDYNTLLAFDKSEIVIGSVSSNTTSMLGRAVLGQMILA